jgi:outer membrane protein TolC
MGLVGMIPAVLAQTPTSCNITLDQVKKWAVKNNEDLLIAQAQYEELSLSIDENEGLFDANLSFDVSHRIDESERVNSVFGTRADTSTLVGQYSKQFHSGTSIETGFRATREKNNSPFITINPAYNSVWYVGLSQVLLNDPATRTKNTQASLRAQLQSVGGQNQYLTQQIIYIAIEKYMQWHGNQQQASLLRESIAQAKAYYETTQQLVRNGHAEKSELYAAKANWMTMQEQLVSNQEESARLQNDLTRLLQHPLKLNQCRSQLTYSTAESLAPVDKLVQQAPAQRPDLVAFGEQARALEIEQKSLQRALNPTLTLQTSLETNDVDQQLGSSLSNSTNAWNPNFFAGANITVPLGKSAQTAALKKTQARLLQVQLREKKARRQAVNDIQNAYISVQTLKARIEQNQAIVNVQQDKLQATEKEFNIGRESLLTLLLYQQDLIAAKRKLLGLEISHELALAYLSLVTGTLTGAS